MGNQQRPFDTTIGCDIFILIQCDILFLNMSLQDGGMFEQTNYEIRVFIFRWNLMGSDIILREVGQSTASELGGR